jgi:hypothetical protein
VELEPLALIARFAALVPPPKRHTVRYFGVLSSHVTARSEVVPVPALPTPRAGQAQEHIEVYSLVRTFATYVRDRDCLPEMQSPAPLDRTHQDRGRRQENPDRDAPAS